MQYTRLLPFHSQECPDVEVLMRLLAEGQTEEPIAKAKYWSDGDGDWD